MLIAGNYRCVQKDEMRPIKDAVHSDAKASRDVYDWVVRLCVSLGASEKNLVPFEKYANAALSLGASGSRTLRLRFFRIKRAPSFSDIRLLVVSLRWRETALTMLTHSPRRTWV